MLASASGTTEIDCFKEVLPYFFGSDVGETHFTAITDDDHGWSSYSGNGVTVFIGGDTTNSLLMTWPTEYVMTDKRPFLIRYYIKANSMSNTQTNSMSKYVWFDDNDMREVLAIYYAYKISTQYVFALIESNTNALFLFAMNSYFQVLNEWKIEFTADSGATSILQKLYFPKMGMMVDLPNDNFIIMINKGDDTSTVQSDPFYGIGIFERLDIRTKTVNLYADSGGSDLADTKMFDCPGATSHHYCRAHTMAYNSNNEIMVGGVHTSSTGAIRLAVHLFDSSTATNVQLSWTGFYDQGSNVASAGMDYSYVAGVCYNTDAWMMVTNSDSTTGQLVFGYRFVVTTGPSVASQTTSYGGSLPRNFLGLHCSSSTKMFHVYDQTEVDGTKTLVLAQVDFLSSATQNTVLLASRSGNYLPFQTDSSFYFSQAIYLKFQSPGNPLQFLIAGSSKSFSATDFTASFSKLTQHGFVVALNSDIFPSCHANLIDQSSGSSVQQVDIGHTWTIDTTKSELDERDSAAKKLFLNLYGLTQESYMYTGTSKFSTVNSGQWCMIFQQFAPQIKDRTTDTTLNAQFGTDYPNLVQDRWDSSTPTRIDTAAHPFQIDDAFGPSNDYYCKEDSDFTWTYTWTTTKADSTSLASTYPTFTRQSGYGNSQRLRFDFQDSSKIYNGVFTIVLTASLPFNLGSETITFYLNNVDQCVSKYNKITVSHSTQTMYLYDLFDSSTDGLISISDDAATLYSTCSNVAYSFEIQVRNYGVSTWSTLSSHSLSNNNFLQLSDNTALNTFKVTFSFDPDNSATVANYANFGTYYYRVRSYNEYCTSSTECVSSEDQLRIYGCKITYDQNQYDGSLKNYYPLGTIAKDYQSDVTSSTYTYFNPIGLFTYEQRFSSSSSNTVGLVDDFTVTFVDAEDGLDHSSDWSGKVSALYDTSSGTAVTQIRIANSALPGDSTVGWHRFKLTPYKQYGSKRYEYSQGKIYFKINKMPQCSLSSSYYDTNSNTANYLSTTSTNQIYYVETPQMEIEFQKFSTFDIYCLQDYHRIIVKQINTDGSQTAVCDAQTTCSFMSLVWDTDFTVTTTKHKVQILTTDRTKIGTYQVTIRSGITLISGGVDEYQDMIFTLEIKDWCPEIQIQFTQDLTSTEYYIWDPSHPAVVKKNEEYKQILLGSLKLVLSGISPTGIATDTEANKQSRIEFFNTYCGAFTITPYFKNGAVYSTDARVQLTVSHSTILDQVNLIIHSTDKTFVPSDVDLTVQTISIQMYFGNYQSNFVQSDIQTNFVDPCNTMYFTFDSSQRDFAQGENSTIVEYMVALPQLILKFQASEVVDGQPQDFSGGGYCGKTQYNVTLLDGTALNSSVFTFQQDILDPEQMLYIETNDHSQRETFYQVQIKVGIENFVDVYNSSTLNFTVYMKTCQVQMLMPPALPSEIMQNSYDYFIGEGQKVLKTTSGFSQIPNCLYDLVVTSSISGGDDVISFENDVASGSLIWKVNVQDPLQGKKKYEIETTCVISSYGQSMTNSDLIWTLNFLNPHSNSKPSFTNYKLPQITQAYTGSIMEFTTGPASLDTASVTVRVMKQEIENGEFVIQEGEFDFISYKIDQGKTWAINFRIEPYENDLGTYMILILMKDNGGDDFEAPNPDLYFAEQIKPLASTYEPTLVVNHTIYEVCKKDCDNPVVSIDSFSSDGILVLKFSQEIHILLDYEDWNTSCPKNLLPMDLEMKPGRDQEMENLEFDWNVTSFESKQLTIQVLYETPLRVSMADSKDTLIVNFLKPWLFKSKAQKAQIKEKNLKVKVETQIPSDDAQGKQLKKASENVKGGMKSGVIINFVVNMGLSGSLQFIWGMINSLQIVFHIPGCSIKMPGNVNGVYGALIAVTQINLIPEDFLQYLQIWDFFTTKEEEEKEGNPKLRFLEEEESQEILENAALAQSIHENTNLNSIGYESTLMVDNLETLLAFIEGYVFIYLLILILRISLQKCCKADRYQRLNNIYNKLVEAMCWNIILRFLLEGYLELCIDVMINIKYQVYQHSSVNEIMSLVFTYGTSFFLFGFPFFILGFFYVKSEQMLLNDEKMQARVGALYEGLQLKEKRGALFNFVFTARRLVFAIVIVFCGDYPWAQIQLNFFISKFIIIYLGKYRPWDNSFSNKLEMFNECVCGMILYHVMLFTDFYDNLEVRYFYVGNSMIYVTFIGIGVNSMIVVFKFAIQLIRSWKKRKAVQRYRNQKKNFQEEIDEAIKKQKIKQANPEQPQLSARAKSNWARKIVEQRMKRDQIQNNLIGKKTTDNANPQFRRINPAAASPVVPMIEHEQGQLDISSDSSSVEDQSKISVEEVKVSSDDVQQKQNLQTYGDDANFYGQQKQTPRFNNVNTHESQLTKTEKTRQISISKPSYYQSKYLDSNTSRKMSVFQKAHFGGGIVQGDLESFTGGKVGIPQGHSYQERFQQQNENKPKQ